MGIFIINNGVGNNVLDIDDFEFNTPLFIDKGEFLPFISVIGNNNNGISYLYDSYSSSNLHKIVNKFNTESSGITSLYSNGFTSHNLSQYATTLKSNIIRFRDMTVETCIIPCNGSYHRTTYDRIIDKLFSTSNTNYFLQSLREIRVGSGMIYLYGSSKILMTLVVPRVLIPYQRMYFILYGKFDLKGTEFWVDETLDTPSTPYKAFRKHYRTKIKAKVIEYEIPIVPKSDIISLLTPKIEYPQHSIDELNSWKEELVKSCIKDLRTKEGINV